LRDLYEAGTGANRRAETQTFADWTKWKRRRRTYEVGALLASGISHGRPQSYRCGRLRAAETWDPGLPTAMGAVWQTGSRV